MRIGVLALQGDVPEHRQALARVVGPAAVGLVDRPEALGAVGALVLTGGESTTLSKLLRETGLFDPLRARIRDGMPV
ncbi:MAG: pyridoxal 5'-phosphate synthase glutaminase subunit PdxT, partial [Thermoplasmata archaeon]